MADSVHSASASVTAGLSNPVKTNFASSSAAYYSPLLCKLFLFLLLLLAIPLLPSHAPDLFNQSFLTNLWELSQLLFIGLAVSYGLFSRRNAEPDDHFAADNSSQFTVDESQSSFVSRIFQVSPLFEDSYEVPSECEDKTAVSHSAPSVQLSAASYGYMAPDAVAYGGYANHQAVSVKNCFEISDDCGGDEVIQAWNAQYFQGQSTVLVSQPNLDVLGQCETDNARKPLGLPVRSLNSSDRDFNMPDLSNNISKAAAESKENDCAYRSGEELFGDVSPLNLEEKFNRTVDYSDFSTRSRSTREATGVVTDVDCSDHFRPLSVDEIQFESLKSESFFGSSKPPISSEDDIMQHSATTQYHTKSNSLPSEFPFADMDESRDEKTFHASNPAVTQPPPARVTGGSRMNAFHLRKYSSTGSLFKKESQGNSRGVLKEKDLDSSKDPLKGLSENKGDEDSEKESLASLKLDKKPDNELVAKPNASRRGKSVRTVRSPGGCSTSEVKRDAAAMVHSYLDDVVGKAFDEIEAVNTSKKNHVAKTSFAEYKKKDRQRSSSSSARGSHDNRVGKTYEAVDGQKRNHVGNAAKATFAELNKRDGRKSTSRVSVEPDELESSKNDNIPVSVDEEGRRGEAGDEHDLDEVDRKAAEFIAKFREQIMLQKVASVERSSRKRGLVKDSR